MKKWRVVETTAFLIAVLALLWGGQGGCKKSNSPFGVNAPQGLDVPTPTPTPISGAIEVFVQDNFVAMQGVTVFIINPSGVTFGPSLTQPTVGMAPINPPNVQPGVWTAFLPTQGVSFMVGLNNNLEPYQRYYYNSTQTFNVSPSGQGSVSFLSTGNNSVSLSPVSQIYPYAYPYDIPLTATYINNGNINVPVSVSCAGLPVGMNSSPTSFILGEGVTVQPINIVKTACYSSDLPFSVNVVDFMNRSVSSSATTLYHDYSVPVSIYYYYNPGGGCSSYDPCTGAGACYCYNFGIQPSNDCGVTWTYSMDTGCGNSGKGTITSGSSGEVSYCLKSGWFVCFTITEPFSSTSFQACGTLNSTGSITNLMVTNYTN